jgi:hypothetical protein
MSKKINSTPDFFTFESETEEYKAPKYLVQPAPGDTGFYMFKKAFDNQKSFFEPRIASSNKELPDSKGQTPDEQEED